MVQYTELNILKEDLIMIYIGIDAAKDKHDCHFVNSDGEVLLDNLRILNNLDGFNTLKQAIEQFSTGDNTQIKVGLESTGSYSANIISFLKHLNLSVTVLNPYNVANLRPATTLRKTKTDKSDARLIATATAFCSPNQTYLDISYHIQTLKSLCRSRYRLIKIIQPIKNRFRRILHVIFPEFETLFNVSLNSSYELLRKYPGPKAILRARKTSLEKFLKDISHGRLTRKADALIEIAKNSIGFYNEGDAFELQDTCDNILFLENKLANLESKIKDTMLIINSPITSIPGIGVTMGATILAEIGNIHKFNSPEKLQAFAGLAPMLYESGKYIAKDTPMDKKGSVYLRNALYQVTKAAYVNSPFLRSYVDKKRAQGKHFYTAMSHGMKKMVRVIFAVLKKNSNFVEPII